MQATVEQQAFEDIWVAISTLAVKDGSAPINKLPGPYCIEAGKWKLWINGTPSDLPASDEHPAIRRFDAYVEFNGWPAGSFNPHEACIAHGELASVFTLRDALKAKAEAE